MSGDPMLYDDGRHSPEQVLADLARWIAELTRGSPRRTPATRDAPFSVTEPRVSGRPRHRRLKGQLCPACGVNGKR